jgi:hemerythrin-like domain-containing protein
MSWRKWMFGAVAGMALAVPAITFLSAPTSPRELAAREPDVTPNEDLMREHGLLRRLLLVYGEIARRLEAGEDVSPKALEESAGILKTFIEGYHEKLEEEFIFPRVKNDKALAGLADTLKRQHLAGRKMTDAIVRAAMDAELSDHWEKPWLAQTLRQFIAMYGPHAAREDTVLFPAFRELLTGEEYARLGDVFEKKEREMFGARGFEKMLDRVADVEKDLGIYDLNQFTPK